MDLDKFSRRMSVIASDVESGAHDIAQKAAIAIDRELVLSTPVDTGRARSNWIASVDTPSDAEGAAESPAAAIARAEAVIKGAGPRQDIWISNNLPYIARLNDGHSAQAPAGFVQSAIVSGSRAVRRSKVLAK